MFSKLTWILSLIIILFVHIMAIDIFAHTTQKVVVKEKPAHTIISVRKVVLKKQVENKPKEIVVAQKIEKIVPKKIVKKAKRKVVKKVVTKKIVHKVKKVITKRVEDKVEKIVKKVTPKIVPNAVKKVVQKTTKKVVISSNKKAIQNEYLLRLRKKIENNKIYPKRAKRLKQQGKVLVSFSIQSDGVIKGVSLVKGSRYKRLNNAALELLKGIARFDSIPKKLGKTTWAIEVPINYSIINI